MKLVLLPGMDGTGEFFSPLLPHLSCDCSVVALPQSGAQDYDTLTAYVAQQLPHEPYVLLAESFSGPIAAQLSRSRPANLIAVIFVATFLSPPAPLWLRVARLLPLKRLVRLPFSSRVIRHLFLGDADNSLLRRFMQILPDIPESVLQRRLEAMATLKLELPGSSLPALYIQAAGDRLVPANKWQEFSRLYGKISREQFDGAHCILQRRPKETAAAINRFLQRVGGAT